MKISHLKMAATAIICAAAIQVTAAMAHGALAIGEPADVGKDGVAVGYAYGFGSTGEAEAEALKKCLSYMQAPDSTRALCKIVQSFHNECFAVALDPADGTEGFGWAVAESQSEAYSIALQKCRDTDGTNADACVVQAQKCDVSDVLD
jgi:hypothetical protein